MGQEAVNNRNIHALNNNQKTQQERINDLEEIVKRLSNTVAILQQELATVKALSAYNLNTGPTA